MDVVRGSLREFGWLLSSMFGDVPEGTVRPQPRRGAVWIVVQVLALAAVLTALLAVAALVIGGPDAAPESPGARLAWALPGFVLVLPLLMHWFAAPPRRASGAVAGLVTALVVGVAVAPVIAAAGWPALWSGLATLVVAMAAAGAVFGAVSTRPAQHQH